MECLAFDFRTGAPRIPLICLAFLLPACAVLLDYHESFANTLTFPAQSDTSKAYHQLVDEFSPGKLSPQYVLVPANGTATVRSDEYFNFSCHLANILLQELAEEPFKLKASDLLSPALMPGSQGLKCLHWNSTGTDELHPFGPITAERLLQLPGDIGESYREQWDKLVSTSTGEHASLLMLTAPCISGRIS